MIYYTYICAIYPIPIAVVAITIRNSPLVSQKLDKIFSLQYMVDALVYNQSVQTAAILENLEEK
jgi:hypothetical protein